MNIKTFLDVIVVGFAIFSTFFGAGSLIYPPGFGMSAGSQWTVALTGFFFGGIVLPVSAVISVGENGGSFDNISRKVSPVFSKIFLLTIMVPILGLVGLPRIGATAYELGLNPIIPDVSRPLATAVYYAITVWLAINPAKVVDNIGKYLAPVLLIVLVFVIGKGIILPMGTPADAVIGNPFTVGFYTGYEMGDSILGITIASVIAAAVMSKGYTDPKKMGKMVTLCTSVAGLGLFLVYGCLAYLGATASGIMDAGMERPALLAAIVTKLHGNIGMAALGIAVIFACLTTSIAVTSAIAGYLKEVSNGKVSYKAAVIIMNVVAGIYSLQGFETIMKLAMPVILVISPAIVTLVVLGLFHKLIPNRGAYIGATYSTILVSVLSTLTTYGVDIKMVSYLPFSKQGFAWVVPAVVGLIVGILVGKNRNKGSSVLKSDLVMNKMEPKNIGNKIK